MPIFKVRQQFSHVAILSCHFELYKHYARKLVALVEPSIAVLEQYSKAGISRATIYRWMKEDPEFEKKVQDASYAGISAINDLAEGLIMHRIKNGDLTAAK